MSGECLLLVDDSRDVRDFFADLVLRPAGYKVITAGDGRDALQITREQHPDLIIADYQMPGLTGIELKKALAAEGDPTPLILITAEGSEHIASKATLAGVAGYLPKPVNSDVLLAAVEQALNNQRVRRDHTLALKALEKRVQELETLQAIGRALTGSLNLDQVLSRVVEAAVNLTGAEEGSLLLVDAHTGELFMRAARNFDDQFVRTFRLRSEDSLAGQVIRTGKPVIIGADSPKKIKTAYLVHSLVYVPLRLQERVIGVLGVDNRQSGRSFVEADFAPLTTLADYAAIAIENARLYSHTDAERNKLDTILQETEDGVIVVDESDRLILINRSARVAFNLNGADPAGAAIRDVIHNHDVNELFNRAGGNTQRNLAEITLEDGRVLNAHVTLITGMGRAVVMQDITHLKQLDKIKSEFVTTVSHDLRSPLTAIVGYVELLGRVGPVNEQQTEFIRRIRVSIHAITTLISDLLDLGRIEAGFDTQKEPTNLPMLIRYAVDGLMARVEIKGQHLLVELPEVAPPVYGNPIRLRQMAANLVDNAIKYTPDGGTVKVQMQEAEDQEILMISDTGIGIPLADQPYVFDKFYRSHNVGQGVVGSGLGLSIVKSIVENHGGRIWVESQPGQGTRFTVVLPKYNTKQKAEGSKQ